MRWNFFEKQYQAFGLHLNSTALKFVEMKQAGKNLEFNGYTNVPIAKSLISGDTILDSAALSHLIERSLVKPQFGKITTNRVIASIPESKSFIRVISIPAMDPSQAENAIILESEAYIPMPIDQVYIDWQVLETKGDMMQVLIVASPRDFVDKFLSVLDKANLKVVALEAESQAIARALLPQDTHNNLMIADLDAFKTALIMIENGELQYTSSVPIAGNTFTDKLSQSLSIPPQKAEEMKKNVGIANTEQFPNLKTYLIPVVRDLASEIRNILKFHYDHSEVKIEHLMLSGGTAKLKNLKEELSPIIAETNPEITVSVADPMINLSGLSNSDLSDYESLSFVVAIGLAMRGIIK